ncbi:MAG: tyrosine-type recombinase/integrase [Dehalococcoidia bacterium]|nr:tyrosine-type recombinase/integrase [Dehalococcoidia bacterium]
MADVVLMKGPMVTVARAPLALNEAVKRFALSNEAGGKSPRTIAWYTAMLGQFIAYLKTIPYPAYLPAISMEKVRDYIIFLHHRPRYEGHPYSPVKAGPPSPKTVQCHVRALKAFASWLHAEGYTTSNHLQHLQLPKAPATIVVPLTTDEINKIIASLNKKSPGGARNHALLVTLLDTGLRASEAAGITLGHLNLVDGHIKVMGKGAKERMVPIGKYASSTLANYIEKVRPSPADPGGDRLFLSPGGKPITPNSINQAFARIAGASGVTKLHAHRCRHTFAINYLMNGGDIFSLKGIMGHATLDMVNHYLHFTLSQITAQHHKFSPMDKLEEAKQL